MLADNYFCVLSLNATPMGFGLLLGYDCYYQNIAPTELRQRPYLSKNTETLPSVHKKF